MKNESEQQIQIRAEMAALLFDVARPEASPSCSNRQPETANTYGVLIILAAAAFAVWYIGKPEASEIVVLSFQAIALGGILILVSEFAVATRLSLFVKSLGKFAMK